MEIGRSKADVAIGPTKSGGEEMRISESSQIGNSNGVPLCEKIRIERGNLYKLAKVSWD
jgi:hypothetical protein